MNLREEEIDIPDEYSDDEDSPHDRVSLRSKNSKYSQFLVSDPTNESQKWFSFSQLLHIFMLLYPTFLCFHYKKIIYSEFFNSGLVLLLVNLIFLEFSPPAPIFEYSHDISKKNSFYVKKSQESKFWDYIFLNYSQIFYLYTLSKP